MSRSLGVLTLDLIARTSSFEQGMDRASRRTRSTTSEFEKAAAAAQKLALAAGAAAAAFAASSAAIVMNAAKAMDATSKMAQQIGVTTEALTGMRFAAQQFSSISDQQFDQAMRRMTRRIEEAAAGSGAAKKALEEMGLSARALSQMTPDRQMLALADAMKRTESQANRLRYTMAIFDTEGMALVPALQQGAAAFEENIKLAERYGVVLSTEAARAAEEFNTNLSHLGSMLDGLKIQLASEVLPTINAFISNVIQATTEVGGLHSEVQSLSGNSAFKAWFEASLVGLARVADVAVFLAKAIGVVGGAFRSVAADAEVALAAINKAQAWNWFSDEATNELQAALAKRNQIVGGFNKELADLFTYQGNRFEQAALSAINTVRIQSDEVKLVDLTTRDLAESTSASTAATKRNSSALTEAQRAAQNFRREQDQSLRSQLQAVSAIHSQAQALEDQIAVYGLGRTALEDLTIARLEERAAMLDGVGDSAEQIEIIEREIEARQRLRTAMGTLEAREEAARANEQMLAEWQRTTEQMGQSLTDALLRGFESGKGFAQNLRDTLKNMFRTLVLQPIIQPIMNQVAGGIQNLLGIGPQGGFGMPPMGGGLSQMIQGAGDKMGSYALQNFAAGLNGYMPTSVDSFYSQSLSTSFAPGSSVPGLGVGPGGGAAGGGIANPSFSASLNGGSSSAANAGQWIRQNGATVLTAASAIYDISKGNYFRAIGTVGGSFLPIPGGQVIGNVIGGVLDGIFGDDVPTTRRSKQGASHMLPDGTFEVSNWDSRQSVESQEAARDFAQAAVKHANELFQRIGVDAGIQSFQTLMESSILGDKQGVGSSGILRLGESLIDIGLAVEASWTRAGVGGWSDAEMLPRLMADINLTVLEAFQAAGDALPSILSRQLEGLDIRSLDISQAEQLIAAFGETINQIDALSEALNNLPFENLRNLSFETTARLIDFAGGVEALNAGLSAYNENFLRAEEQLAHQVAQLTQVFSELGFTIPDVYQSGEIAKNQFRAIAESLDVTTEEGARAFATLMTVAGSFSEAANAADQLAEASRRAAQEQGRLLQEAFNQAVAEGEAAYNALARSISARKERLRRDSEQISQALQNAIGSTTETVRSLTTLAGQLTSTLNRMLTQITDEAQNRQWAQERISRALSVATLTGVLPEGPDFEQALQIVTQPSQGLFENFEDYQADFLRTAHDINALNEITGVQLSTEQRALESLESQLSQHQEWYQAEIARLDGVLEYNRMQLDIAAGTYQVELSQLDAIKAVEAAVKNIRLAAQNQSRAPSGLSREDQYLIDNPDVMADYLRGVGGNMTAAELARYHYEHYGRYEGRSFAVGTNYVPHDMVAQIHQGERIIPAADNRELMWALQSNRSNDNALRLVQQELREMRLMQQTLLDEIAKNTQDTARTNEQMIMEPQPVRVAGVVSTVAAVPGQ